MDEIALLQQELASIQQERRPRSLLSASTTITLITKIQELHLLPPLIFPQTRDAFYTPSHLTSTIRDLLDSHGGRLSLPELSVLLAVSPAHLTRALEPLLRAEPPQALLTNSASTVLTPSYLTSLAAAAAQALLTAPAGRLPLPALAAAHGLPLALVVATVRQHLAHPDPAAPRIAGRLAPDRPELVSAAADARERAVARGALRATTVPTPLAGLAGTHGVPPEALRAVAAELPGAGRVTKGLYEPLVFARAREERLRDFWRTNRFLDDKRLAGAWEGRGEWTHVAEYVERKFGKALRLSGACLAVEVLERLEEAVQEAVQEGSWVDVGAALPAGLTEAQVREVVVMLMGETEEGEAGKYESGRRKGASKKGRNDTETKEENGDVQGLTSFKRGSAIKKGSAFGVGNRYIVSSALVKVCEDKLREDATEKAVQWCEKHAEQRTQSQTYTGMVEPKMGNGSQEIVERVAEERVGSPKRKKKPQRRIRKRGKAEKVEKTSLSVAESLSQRVVQVAVPTESDMVLLLAQTPEIAGIVEYDLLGAAGGTGTAHEADKLSDNAVGEADGDVGDLLGAIVCSRLKELAPHIYSSAVEEMKAKLECETVEAVAKLSRMTLASLLEAELFQRTAITLSEPLQGMSCEYVLENLSSTTWNILAMIANTQLGMKIELSARSAPQKLFKDLPPDIQSKTRPLLTAETVADYVSTYDTLSLMFDLPTRQVLDEGQDRALSSHLRASLVSVLESAEQRGDFKSPAGAALCAETLWAAARLAHLTKAGGAVVAIPPTGALELCADLETRAGAAECEPVRALEVLKDGTMTLLKLVDEQGSEEAVGVAWGRFKKAVGKMLEVVR